MIHIFVYGTLKRGYGNFNRYCTSACSIKPARVWGRLYQLPQGYPMLAVPVGQMLAMGTGHPAEDEQLQHAWRQRPADDANDGPWELISGEVLSFPDAESCLPPLDALEDFRPPERQTYHRVLLHTEPPGPPAVWAYVAPNGKLPAGARRIGTSWPPEESPAE